MRDYPSMTKAELLSAADTLMLRGEVEQLVRALDAGYRPYVGQDADGTVVLVGWSNPDRDGPPPPWSG